MVVPRLDGLDGLFKRPFQNTLADSPQYQGEQPSCEVLAFACDNHVNVCGAIGQTGEDVAVPGRASPSIGVNRVYDNAVGIGPVVVRRSQIPCDPSVTSACERLTL